MNRHSQILQALYNGWVDLDPRAAASTPSGIVSDQARPRSESPARRSPPDALQEHLREVPAWLKLLSPTRSWPVGQVFRWPFASTVTCLAVRPRQWGEPTDPWIAIGLETGEIHLYDLQSGLGVQNPEGQPLVLRGHEGRVKVLAWTPNGHRLASRSRIGPVRIWDGQTGVLRHTLPGHGHTVLVWAPDGRRLASGGSNGRVRVWDGQTGVVRHEWWGHEGKLTALAWTPDGDRLVSGSADGTVRVWDGQSGELLRTLPGHERGVTALMWTPDGHRLASANEDGTVRIWDVQHGTQLALIAHVWGARTTDVWSPNGYGLAVAERDVLRVFDLRDLPLESERKDWCEKARFGANTDLRALCWTAGSREIRAADHGPATGQPQHLPLPPGRAWLGNLTVYLSAIKSLRS